MTQYAYAGHDAIVPPEPDRTSLMALFSTVLSVLGCCLPGSGLLGVIFGVAGVVGIGRSGGRIGGKGLAFTGIIVGLLTTILWIGAYFGVIAGEKFFHQASIEPIGRLIESIQTGDFEEASKHFGPGTQALATDEAFISFRAAYEAEIGAFDRVPESWFEAGGLFEQFGPAMQNLQTNNQGIIPIPAYFDGGPAMIFGELDQAAQNGIQASPGDPEFRLPLINLRIITLDGTEILLFDTSVPPPLPTPPMALPEALTEPAPEETEDPDQPDEDG